MNNSPDSKESGFSIYNNLFISVLQWMLELEIHENQLINVAKLVLPH